MNESPEPSVHAMRRVGWGVGALGVQNGVNVLGLVLLVPVAMATWGKTRYGEWILLSGLVTVLKISDLGLQTVVVNRLTAAFARNERDAFHEALHSGLRVQASLALLAMGLVLSVAAFLPIPSLLSLQTTGDKEVAAVIVLLVFELLLGVPMGTVAGVYRATGHLPRAAIIGGCQQFLLVASTIALVASGAGLAMVALGRCLVALAISTAILVDLKSLHPWLDLYPSRGSALDGLRMVLPGLFFLAIPLADYFGTQLTLAIVQHHFGGAEVSRLATHRTLIGASTMLSGLLVTAAWPEVTALRARSQTDQLRHAHRLLVRLSLWATSCAGLLLAAFSPWIYSHWTLRALVLDSVTLGILLTRSVFWSVWNTSATVLMATDRQRIVSLAGFASSLTAVVGAAFMVPAWGIAGAALAGLAGDLLVSAWLIPMFACRLSDDPPLNFALGVARAFGLGVALPAAIALLAWQLVPWEAARLGVVVPVVCAGTAAYYYKSGLRSGILESRGD